MSSIVLGPDERFIMNRTPSSIDRIYVNRVGSDDNGRTFWVSGKHINRDNTPGRRRAIGKVWDPDILSRVTRERILDAVVEQRQCELDDALVVRSNFVWEPHHG